MIRQKFSQKKIPLALGLAIAMKESSMRYDVEPVTSGGDGLRGGSYGLFMVSFKTAKGLGYTGTAKDLSAVKKNISMAAKLIEQDMKRFKGNIKDVIAAYNSGKEFDEAPEVTRNDYVPKVLEYMKEFEEYIRNR